MEYKVSYPTPLCEIADPENDNVDVCVAMPDGSSYTIVCITPRNLAALMDRDGGTFIHPGFRFAVVRRIDRACIEDALRVITADPELLSYYGSDQT